MANLTGVGYTNRFAVRSEEVDNVKRFCSLWDLRYEYNEPANEDEYHDFQLRPPEDDTGCWPSFKEKDDFNETELAFIAEIYPDHDWEENNELEYGICEFIGPRLVEDDVFIIAGISNVAERSIDAFACAVNCRGDVEALRLTDINDIALKLQHNNASLIGNAEETYFEFSRL